MSSAAQSRAHPARCGAASTAMPGPGGGETHTAVSQPQEGPAPAVSESGACNGHANRGKQATKKKKKLAHPVQRSSLAYKTHLTKFRRTILGIGLACTTKDPDSPLKRAFAWTDSDRTRGMALSQKWGYLG